jgi:hypothetical protein
MTNRKHVSCDKGVMGCYETHDISDFIKMLQDLQAEGWETVEIDMKNYEYDSNDYYYLKVSKTCPETDAEYNKRISQENECREKRRWHYEQLKKEFGE